MVALRFVVFEANQTSGIFVREWCCVCQSHAVRLFFQFAKIWSITQNLFLNKLHSFARNILVDCLWWVDLYSCIGCSTCSRTSSASTAACWRSRSSWHLKFNK
jgi:hypothetical protein